MEIWRDIKEYEGLYQVSSEGRVKSLNYNRTGEERIMKGRNNTIGYLQVNLYKEGKRKNYSIHRLVAQAFLENPNNLTQVNHKDENPQNNRVDNLEWCSPQYNSNYGTRNEKVAKSHSIPILQFSKTGEFIKMWGSTEEASRELNIFRSSINECCRGRRKTCGGYKWHYHYKSLWLKKHIPLIKQKKVA